MATKNTLTYKDFAAKIADLLCDMADGNTPVLSDAELTALIEKANALYTREATKAEAAKTRTSKKNADKPANPLTARILAALSPDDFMTGAEIGAAIGEEHLDGLTISNALRSAKSDGVVIADKVDREVMGSNGKPTKRKYTAYKLA